MNKNSNESKNEQLENQNNQVPDQQESPEQVYEKVDKVGEKVKGEAEKVSDNLSDTIDHTTNIINKEIEKRKSQQEQKDKENESDNFSEGEKSKDTENLNSSENAEEIDTPKGEEGQSELAPDGDHNNFLNSENDLEPKTNADVPESGQTPGIDQGPANGTTGLNGGEVLGPESPTAGIDALDGAVTGTESTLTGVEGAQTGAESITAGTEGVTTGVESATAGTESIAAGVEGVAAGAQGAAAGAEGAAAAAETATVAAETTAEVAPTAIEGATEAVTAAGEGLISIGPYGWIAIGVILLLIAIVIGIIALVSSASADEGTGTGAIGYEEINPTDEEMFLMYSLAIHERGDGTEEQMSYVISVVLNRVLTGRYGGDTVRDVIYSPNQFEGVTQVEYSGGHYTSGEGTTWQNQCQAVENYLTTGNTNTVSYPNEAVEKAINATRKVLENGDTTDTPEYPNGGATGFATPYYVLSWSEAGPDHWFQTGGYFGMFNDVDGKEAGTSGHNYNNRNSYSSNFFSSTTDQEILSQYVSVPPTTTTGSNNLINGNIIDTSRPVYIGHQYTNLTETQKRQLAYVAYREQGSIEGAKLELSLMANLTEERRNDYNIYEYVMYSGWFGSANPSHIPQYTSDFTSAYVQLVDEILVNGNRYLTNNINEHDCLSDISSITTGNANNRSNYIPNETVINNVYGARYVFVGFAPNNGDPFGYTL